MDSSKKVFFTVHEKEEKLFFTGIHFQDYIERRLLHSTHVKRFFIYFLFSTTTLHIERKGRIDIQ